MYGAGSLGEVLSGTKTFSITNFTNSLGQYPVGYLTLEGNSTANQELTSTTYITGSFGSFDVVEEESLISSSTGFSIPISEFTSSFTFTPTSTVAANSYYIRSTGNFNLTIS